MLSLLVESMSVCLFTCFLHAFYEIVMLTGSLMVRKHCIKSNLLASLLTRPCVEPRQLSDACLISAVLSCPATHRFFFSFFFLPAAKQ